jgi:cytidyltransferase-like protein
MSQNWIDKVHVESSLPKSRNQFAFFIGRWQPLHEGHIAMFNRVLQKGGNVCIAIRNIQPDAKNPFSPLEVMSNIMDKYEALIQSNRVKVLIIPDICSVNFGRGVGYDIVEHIPPTEIGEISSTKIREEMRLNGEL